MSRRQVGRLQNLSCPVKPAHDGMPAPDPGSELIRQPMQSRPRILHIIEQFRRGGPAYALTGLARYSSRANGYDHRVLSLLTSDPVANMRAAAAGLTVIDRSDPLAIRAEVMRADVVQFHFWNSAELHALLASDLPACRLLVWCHVNGASPPHILPHWLPTRADMLVATAPSTLQLPAFQTADPNRLEFIPGGADFSDLGEYGITEHAGFNVGYIGRLDFVKMHPDFVSMCVAVRAPDIHFHVCGDGGSREQLRRQAQDSGAEHRFTFHDFLRDIRPMVSALDVFGYPLCKGNSTTAELVLQEVMFLGVPPLVMPYGGAADLVRHGYSGIIARDEVDYAQALDWLYRNPDARLQLGRNAAYEARAHFGAERTAARFDGLYARILRQPKRPRRAIVQDGPQSSRGARALIRSLDGVEDHDFVASLSAEDGEAAAADQRIAETTPGMSDIILQYRIRYPDDAYLRLWAGLVLETRGRMALAASEFKASMTRGERLDRVGRYFGRAARQAGVQSSSRDRALTASRHAHDE